MSTVKINRKESLKNIDTNLNNIIGNLSSNPHEINHLRNGSFGNLFSHSFEEFENYLNRKIKKKSQHQLDDYLTKLLVIGTLIDDNETMLKVVGFDTQRLRKLVDKKYKSKTNMSIDRVYALAESHI